jgi:hypothetical protein
VAGAAAAGPDKSKAPANTLDVMLQNQYLGTDLGPVITAPPDKLNDRVVQALENVAASLPTERLGRLAKLIADRAPHVVALNEAFAYSCQNMAVDTPAFEGCGNQRIKGAFVDFLATTEANLAGKYVTKARVQNFAVAGLPFQIDGYWALLAVKDRDAIMVRSDVAPMAAPVPLALNPACRQSLEGCNFQAVPTVTTALGDIKVERGFTAVDLAVSGQVYRVFATHLEQRQLVPGNDPSRVLQRLQAAELVQTALEFPAAAGTRKLVLGDINSAPTDELNLLPTPIGQLPPPYFIFTGGGFIDTWTLRPGAASGKGAPLVGFSCCQLEDLSNHKSVLYERIDMIFSLTKPASVKDARLLGEVVADKTWPPGLGLWPSDHASVAAGLQY